MTRHKLPAVLLPVCIIACACSANNNIAEKAITINPNITEISSGLLAASTNKNTSPEKATASRHTADPIILSEFTTAFDTKDAARKKNIELSSAAINGVIIQPDETFSYNETVGPTTKANGYKPARIFIKGKKAKGYGGGVCQVSSALYNAADDAGLTITERHPHSLPVYYVPEGRDAATSYGGLDLKFENPNKYPVKIVCTANDGEVIVRIEKA